MSDRYGGSKSADRLLVDNHDAAISGLKVLQETTSGTVSAVHIESSNTTSGSKALSVRGGADLISVRTLADTEQFKVDQSGNVTAGGTVLGAGTSFVPSDVGLIAWNWDPLSYQTNTASVNGTIYLMQFILRAPATITNGAFLIATAAAVATASQNYIALVDSTGAIKASTAAGDIDTLTQSAGWCSHAFTAPYAAPAGKYWIAVLLNAGTPAKFGALVLQSSAGSEAGITSAPLFRFAVNGTGATALPGSFTPASNSHTNVIAFSVGVS